MMRNDRESIEWELACALRQRAAPRLICSLLRRLSYDGEMTEACQQALLRHWSRPLDMLIPPSAESRCRVLKAVVLAAEQDGTVSEEIIEMYTAALLNQACDTDAVLPEPSPGWAYKLYSYAPAAEPLASTLQHLNALEQQVVERCRPKQQQQQQQEEQEEEQVVVSAGARQHGLLTLRLSLNLLEGATGCHEWEAGFFVAEFVLSHPELVQGRHCLELGCGAGMLGVVMHRAGAAGLTLTDGDAQTLANAAFNLRLNGVPLADAAQYGCTAATCEMSDVAAAASSGNHSNGRSGPGWVCCRQLVWEDGWDSHCPGCQPELVFGADLLYDPGHIPGVLSFLKQVLHPSLAAAAQAAPQIPAAATVQGAAEAACQCCVSQTRQHPAAYLATMLRNESTLMQFLEAARSEPCLHIQELAGGTESGMCSDPQSAICFQHLPELEATRPRIFLHRITYVRSC